MNARFIFRMVLIAVIGLTACTPATENLIQTTSPVPTATRRSPTATKSAPTPTFTLSPGPELSNEYKAENFPFQFDYPADWKTVEASSITLLMPGEFADEFDLDNPVFPRIYSLFSGFRLELLGDLFTDGNSIKKPEEVWELIPRWEELASAFEDNPGEGSNIEINGYPAYEITAKGEEGQYYVAVILAEEFGVAIRFVGVSAAEDWQDTQPYFKAIARSTTPIPMNPISQNDASLEGLVLPHGNEYLVEDSYVNDAKGFQIQYPQDWVISEWDEIIMFSPDEEHSLLGVKTRVVVAAFTEHGIVDIFKQASFDNPADEGEISDRFVAILNEYSGTDSTSSEMEHFTINGNQAIGMQVWGTYYIDYDYSFPNPVKGYILAVKSGDRVVVFFATAPTRFWRQFRPILLDMLESLEFTPGALPPTPTPTSTPTLIPPPANHTPSPDLFIFNGTKLEIPDTVLEQDCYKAVLSVDPNAMSDTALINQPAGTNCLLIVVTSLPGEETGEGEITLYDLLLRMKTATVVDQMGTSYSLDVPMISFSDGRAFTRLFAYPDRSATSFTLHLPDGQEIMLTLASPPPERPPTASPVPTFTPPPASSQVAGEKFLDEHGVEMVFIPAGEFQMGRPEEESVEACQQVKGNHCIQFHDMAPEHTVMLDAYYIDVLEVTNARYAECVAAGICLPPGSTESATYSSYYGNPEFDDYPVIFVDWQMARTYCQWRNADLPTEAQWEKAARGNNDRWFPWGDVLDGKHANFNDVNSSTDGGRKDLDDGYADIAPADAFPEGASIYGILNMAGNVWEWILDGYSAVFYDESPTDNPIGSNVIDQRVIRGGSWSAYEVYTLWVSTRDGLNPKDWNRGLGFRCSRSQ